MSGIHNRLQSVRTPITDKDVSAGLNIEQNGHVKDDAKSCLVTVLRSQEKMSRLTRRQHSTRNIMNPQHHYQPDSGMTSTTMTVTTTTTTASTS
eukprot:112974-Amphidinium_carterae.1